MKVLRIALTNLNSLRGEHRVDLTVEPLAGAGLFAITGPTGAGKSTLLDALTLALYGRAARYGNTPNPQDVMSRYCGECWAEVEFMVPAGQFRAVWQLRRSRGRADGAIQQAQRYVYNQAGEPLTQKIGESEHKIEELIGLDYARFLRSALLAQGEFAQFLKAKPAERADLLESLTGTEIYGELGIRAHETARELKQKLEQSQLRFLQIPALAEPDRAALDAEIQTVHSRYKALEQATREGSQALSAIARLEEARQQEAASRRSLNELEAERVNRSEDLEPLARHRVVQPFIEPLTRLDAAEREWNTRAEALGASRAAHDAAIAEALSANAVLHRSLRAAIKACTVELNQARANAEAVGRTVSDERRWIQDHPSDGLVAERLPELVDMVGRLRSVRTSLQSRWAEMIHRAENPFSSTVTGGLPERVEGLPWTDIESAVDGYLSRAQSAHLVAQSVAADAERRLRLDRNHLESARRIAGYEQQRGMLVEGEPCPLCGSTDHPFAEGTVPDFAISELQAEVDASEKHWHDLSRTMDRMVSTLQHLQSQKLQLCEQARERDDRETELTSELVGLGIDMPDPAEEQSLLDGLKTIAETVRFHFQTLNSAERELSGITQTVQNAERTLVSLAGKVSRLDAPPVPDTETTTAAQQQPLDPEEAEADYRRAGQGLETAEAMMESRTLEEASARTRLEEARAQVETLVQESGFTSVAELRSSRLSGETAAEIERFERDIHSRIAEAATLLRRAEDEIAGLRIAKTLEGDAAEAFRGEHQRHQDELTDRLRELTTLQNRRDTDNQNRAMREAAELELENERGRLAVWAQLSQLIGSHDGSKFRKFAQSISLDLLTRHANHHLAHLSDRYQIRRDDANELGLLIEDLHQAGAHRPMESLSGGESFLASLALALGLSDLAGRSVQIESLFIDEGFGSLDPETLDVAISALETLQQNRKTVGVISHVSLLKERISTQIVVEKLSGGTSRIRIVG